MSTLRSSARRTPRKKYTVDAFEGIAELQAEAASGEDNDANHEEDSGNDFEAEPEAPDLEENIDFGEDGVDEDGDIGSQASGAEDMDSDENVSVFDDSDEEGESGNASNRMSRASGQSQPKFTADGQRLYTRGIKEGSINRLSGQWRRANFFGPAPEDFDPIRRSSTRWSHDATFPTRKERRRGRGGLEYPISYIEASESAGLHWQWYTSDGGQAVFQERQILRELPADQATEYLVVDGAGERNVVLGPIAKQQFFTLTARQSVPLTAPFSTEENNRSKLFRAGFLMNVGARVQALDWASSQGGQDQYLAVSLLPKTDRDGNQYQASEAPSFCPQEPCRSSVQIWRFIANAENSIDTTMAPQLAMVLCTDIGQIKALKWCPVPSKIAGSLGLLACISTDGGIRVLDLGVPPNASETAYLAVEQFAFESKPPNTVCTCISWISSTRIAAGCANGFLAVWDLAQSLAAAKANPRPLIYASISVTYILAITSCWPSYPHLMLASSMSGHLTVTDLSKPNPAAPSNTAQSVRARIGQPMLMWSDFIHSALSVDDGYLMRCYLLRRFSKTIGAGRFRAMPLCMANSPCHPFILVGLANGEAVAFNPVIRIARGSKAQLLQQVWLKHEWRRPTPAEASTASSEDQPTSEHDREVRAAIAREGLARISEGYRVEKTNLHSDGRTSFNVRDGVIFATVYEERTAVTALAWNYNLHVGGWAAAGMGDGLLRIEDIAV